MIPEITIKINNIDYKVKKNNRSLIEFEYLTKNSVEALQPTFTGIIKMFYSILKGNNKHFNISFDEFVDLLDEYDEDNVAFEQFKSYLKLLGENENIEPTDKKKVKQK